MRFAFVQIFFFFLRKSFRRYSPYVEDVRMNSSSAMQAAMPDAAADLSYSFLSLFAFADAVLKGQNMQQNRIENLKKN